MGGRAHLAIDGDDDNVCGAWGGGTLGGDRTCSRVEELGLDVDCGFVLVGGGGFLAGTAHFE